MISCPACHAVVPDSALEVADVLVVLAMPSDEAIGILAHANVIVGPFRIAAMTVRLTSDGRRILTYPARARGTADRRTYFVVPRDDVLRAKIETAVIKAYVEARRKAGRRMP